MGKERQVGLERQIEKREKDSSKLRRLEVDARVRVKTLLKLFKELGIRKDKIVAANHNDKGPTFIDIFPNASSEFRLPVIHIQANKKGRLRYFVSSPQPVDQTIMPVEDDPFIFGPARDLSLPVMEGTRIGLVFKTHLNPKGDKFVYYLDEETGAFRIALPRSRHCGHAVEIGGEKVIGLEFRPKVNAEGDAISSGRVLFLGPPE